MRIDCFGEFAISNSFDAEYGRNSGAVVNVVTKSGTNNVHGGFYEFLRNDLLNTHPFTFSPSPKPAFKQNQFGGTIGGPIKKDKTFFFASYEGRRIVQGIVSQPVTVPTAAEVGGDFSGGGGATPFQGTLTDATVAGVLNDRTGCASAVNAAGGAPIAAGTPYSAIFPNNKIPTQCFDPVAVSLLQYVPGAGGASNTRAGETLRVVVQGHDVNRYEEGLFAQRHEYLKNEGRHLIHTGGRYDSYLLLPTIPGRK